MPADKTEPTATGATSPNPDQQALEPIVQEIRQTVRTELEHVRHTLDSMTRRHDALEQTLSELARPQSQAGTDGARLFAGRAPGLRTGEDPLTSRGYQISRVIWALVTGNWDCAKIEREVHDRLYEVYGGHLGEGAALVPLGGQHLQRIEPGFAAEVQQLLRHGVAGADLDEVRRVAQMAALFGGIVRQDLSIWDDQGGAVWLGEIQQGELIDLLRAREVFSRAGAREFTLPPNGRIQFPRKTGGASAYWVGEAEEISETTVQTGMLTMIARKLAAIVPVPNELIRFATASVEAFLREELATALALKADESFLKGNDANGVEPKGLIYYDINTRTASTTGADGDRLEPEDIALAVAEVEEQNVDVNRFTFVARPMLWAAIRNRRADAVVEGDAKGQFVFRTESDPRRGDSLDGYRFIRSTQVPNNRTKGASNNLTLLLGGVFREYLIGRVGALEFAINTQSDTNFKRDLTSLRAIQHMDGGPRQEKAFVMIDTLLNA